MKEGNDTATVKVLEVNRLGVGGGVGEIGNETGEEEGEGEQPHLRRKGKDEKQYRITKARAEEHPPRTKALDEFGAGDESQEFAAG